MNSNAVLIGLLRESGDPFATWNPSDKDANITLSGGDLIATKTGGSGFLGVRANIGKTSGKYYFEIVPDTLVGNGLYGWIPSNFGLSGFPNNSQSTVLYRAGQFYFDGVYEKNGPAVATDDVVMVALDMTAGKIWFGVNGTWWDSGDPAAGTGEVRSGLTIETFPYYGNSVTNGDGVANFGDSSFVYSAPSGFVGVS